MAPIYKISYVVLGEDHPGAILNSDEPPEVGSRINLGNREFVIMEVLDLIPARGDFHFLHATLRAITPER